MEHKIIQEVLYKWPYNVCAIWIWKYTKLSLNDRLEVTSPGGLYNGLIYEEVMNGHSKIRNKGIANIFSKMGLVEAWGNGIKRILNAAEEYGLPKPWFQEFDNMFRVELFRNSFPMMEENRDIGEASEKHRRSIGNRKTNRT